MSFYSGKNVVVTGASSGIGKALCMQLASAGATVFAVARREHKLQELCTAVKTNVGHIVPVVFDITSDDFTMVKEKIRVHTSKVDIIINNAGSGSYGPFMESNHALDEKVVTTNILGTLHFLREVYRHFMQQNSDTHIVITTSLAGKIGFANLGVYSATKFALEGFAESLRTELARQQVAVTVFRPGVVATEFFENANMKAYETEAHQRGWLRRPDAVAHYLLKKIPQKKKAITIGGDALFLKLQPFISEKLKFVVLNLLNKIIP